jgi:hypothetical protein
MVRSAAESGFEDSSSPDVMKAGIGTKSAELRRGICLHRNCALVQLLFSRRLQLRLPCGALSVWAMLLSGWRTQLHADDALIPLSFRCPARGTHAAVPASLLAAGHAYTPTRASAAAHLDPSPRNRLRRGSSQLLRVDFAPRCACHHAFPERSAAATANVLPSYPGTGVYAVRSARSVRLSSRGRPASLFGHGLIPILFGPTRPHPNRAKLRPT